MTSLFEIPVKTITGEETTLASFQGYVLLIVNVASKCGFTSQYKELEELYQKHKQKNFAVLGFPCNQFGGQEPGSDEEIAQFCELTYHVTFPMFAKVDVNGSSAHPLFQELKSRALGVLGSEAIKWNFTKFLVARNGINIQRYASITSPIQLEEHVSGLLSG